MPIRPQTSTTTPADSSTASGIDPDVVAAALLERVQSIFLTNLQVALPEATMTPREGLHDDRRYQVSAAVGNALAELNLEAQRLRGRRLVRRMVLAEVQSMCEELIELEMERNHGEAGIKYGRLIRRLLHFYLEREERHDAHPWRTTRSLQVGLDPNDPPPYKAPPVPPMPNDPIPKES